MLVLGALVFKHLMNGNVDVSGFKASAVPGIPRYSEGRDSLPEKAPSRFLPKKAWIDEFATRILDGDMEENLQPAAVHVVSAKVTHRSRRGSVVFRWNNCSALVVVFCKRVLLCIFSHICIFVLNLLVPVREKWWKHLENLAPYSHAFFVHLSGTKS